MLLHVKYGYHVEAIPRRGRLARHMAFLDETAIEIPEIAASETDVRLDVEESTFPGTSVSRWRIVARGDRLFRPVPSGGVRPFDLDLWARMRAEGLAPDRENDTLGLSALVDEPPPRGEETIYGAGLYHPWPQHRIDEVPLRALIADHREADHARLQRDAARLLLIGGVLHVETSEPVWVADYRSKRLLIRGAREQIARSSLVHWNRHPFAAYDMFRLDRTDAVSRAVTRGGGLALFNASLIKARPRGFVPAAPDTAPMLRMMIDFARELVAHELRRTGDRKDAVPTNYPELMADFAFPAPNAGPCTHLRALEAIADRLAAYSTGKEKGVRHAVAGHFRNGAWVKPSVAFNPSSDDHSTVAAYIRCLGPAVCRALAEEKEGLLVDEMTPADESALASLAP